MGYMEGGIGAIQVGKAEYRPSLSLNQSYKFLGSTRNVLGGATTYIGIPLSVGLDVNALNKGEISGGLFAYRTTGTLSSVLVAAKVGAKLGGPYGAAAGGLTAGLFVAGEHAFKGVKCVWNETLMQISNIENAIKSGIWYPGR